MSEGPDYSYSRPSVSCIASQGMQFVVRYIGPPDVNQGKMIDVAERDAIFAQGLDLVLVYEGHAGDPLAGFAAGQGAGQDTARWIDKLDVPADRPIYFALDVDPNPLSLAEWGQVRLFLDGAASVLGRHRVGIYGGRKAIETTVPQWAPWGWQTRAWSVVAGTVRWDPNAQLQQYNLGPAGQGLAMCGGTVDINRSTIDDFGQWGPGTTQEDDVSKEDVTKALDEAAVRVFGISSYPAFLATVLAVARDAKDEAREAHVDANEARKELAAAKAEILAKVSTASVPAIDYAKLAEALVKELRKP